MARQREEARRSWVGSGEAATEAVWFALREEIGATEFLGYETETAEGVVLAILRDGARVDRGGGRRRGRGGRQPDAVLCGIGRADRRHRQRCFRRRRRACGAATRSRRPAICMSISAALTHGALKVGDAVELRVDGARRRRLRANHSVTHLLAPGAAPPPRRACDAKGLARRPRPAALRFQPPEAARPEDIRAIEAEVNDRIRANAEVRTRLLTPDRAVAEGALALFGEKYGDEVRVVAMGGMLDGEDRPFSVELCGGTHVAPHRRYRAVQDRLRKRDRLGRAPHRGADRRRRRGLSGRGGRVAAPGRRRAAHEPGGIAGAHCRASSTSAAGSNANWPRRGGRWQAPARRPKPAAKQHRRDRLSTAGSSTTCPAAS